MINLDVWLKFYHGWLELVAYIEWITQLEYWKLKCEIKDLFFIAFQQKKNQSLTSLACLVKRTKYIRWRVSLAEY